MCSPFSHEAYGNRAIAYLKMREYQAALSDSYRCIVLNPDGWKGYSRYSCALRALGEEVKAECIYHEVQTCLPHYKSTLTQEWSKFSEIFSKLSIKKEKEERKRAASPEESDPKAVEGAEKKGDKPKKKSKKQEMQQKKLTKKFEVINEHLKRGSLSLRQHDPHTSSEEFERALQLIGENKSKWAENEGADCNKLFNVILYLNAKAEFEMGSMARVENLLSNISHNKSLFPACHLLTARGQMCAHRYKDAERSLYQALTQLPIYARNFTTINWPGLKEPIEELRPSALEWTIRRLREFCTPRGTPDYICRYHGCSQHHLTSSIYLNDRANKECIVIVCWSGCSLSVHHDCWKRQREELVITNDKDMLGQACLTPDCDGTIVEIRILEGHNVKYRMQSSERREPLKPVIVKANRQPVCSEAHKKRILRKKLEALNRKSQATTTASKSSLNTQDIQASTRETVSESIPKSPQSDSRTGSELLQREQECEEGLDKKEGKQRKAKKKKSKGSDEHSNSAAAEISQLFTLASNDGRTIISANDDIDHSGNLVSSEISSEGPFQVPERLKSAHQQFEQQFTLERGRGEQQSTSEKGRGEMGASMQPDPEAPLSRPFNTVVKSSPKPPLTSTEEGLLQ
jgi:tetratricopeptide (TPR) repeat protein